MQKKPIVLAAGIIALTASTMASAQSFSFNELVNIGASMPTIGDLAGDADLNTPSQTITLDNGSTLKIATLDGNRYLSDVLATNDADLIIDGKKVNITTTASSLESAYDNPSQNASFTISAITETRPVTLEWSGSLGDIDKTGTFDIKLNGTPYTLELPSDTTLTQFNGQTPVTIRNRGGKVLFSGRLDNITGDQINEIASILGVLNADKSLRAAQKQAMAQSFGMLSEQIDVAMAPSNHSLHRNSTEDSDRFNLSEGLSLWVSTEVGDLSGNSAGLKYDGDSKAAMAGIDKRMGNVLAGVAAGYSKFDLTSDYGNSDLSGNLIAPYAAINLLNNNLVLSGILLYQDLEGEYSYGNPTTEWDGDRYGARVAGTYYLPRFGSNENLLAGVTLGGAYLDDDLDDSYSHNIGAKLGEAFGGINLSTQLAAGRLFGSVTYYEDVTSDFDGAASVLESEDDSRTEVKLGVAHRLGTNMTFNLSGKTTVGDSDTEYDAVQASIAYSL
ncbi:hypothetical protein IOC61_03355 [Halomonas sp. KAO]|uniref:hypothetical protein n=1 Tax=Halomonas sp. KAO TaxID=2783858 RepID=UPI00189F7EE9|nr:hypothetical protein [Halomonas sp. KAO]MBF7052353.1 hypothetical protein [Halomonas sp. KAO]